MDYEKTVLKFFVTLLLAFIFVVWTTPMCIILSSSWSISELMIREFLESLSLSIMTSATATLLVLIFSIPTSFYLSRFARGLSKKTLFALVMTPMIISPSAIGTALLLFFTRNPIGILINRYMDLVNDPKGIIVAQFVIGLPLSIGYYVALFSSIPIQYEEIALIHGLNRIEYLYRVLLPMIRRQVFLGLVLVFTRVFADFGASLVIGGGIRGKTWTLPILIYMSMQYGELALLSTILSIYFLTALIIYLLILSIEYEKGKST